MLRIISGETVKPVNKQIKDIQRLSEDIHNCIFFRQPHLILKDRIVFLNQYDIFRILVEIKTRETSIKDILLRHVYKLEQQSVGSSIILLSLLSNKKIEIESVKRLSRETLDDLFSYVDVGNLQHSIIEAFDNSSTNTSLLVNFCESDSHVVYSNTLEFPITQINEFGDKHVFDEVKFVLYDGVVERVSQLEKILYKNVNEKIPIIVFSKGFAYEVVSTLLHNFRNKITSVIPITSNVDWSSEFIIKDFATCANMNCENIEISEKSFKNIKIENNKIFLQDIELLKNSQSLISKIKRESIELIGFNELIEKRLRFLSSDRIEIFIGNEFGEAKNIVSDRLNYISRLLISCKSQEIMRVKIDNHTHFCSYDAIKKAINAKNSIINLLSSSKVVKNVG